MRRITIGLSLIALIVSLAEPAIAGRQGVPSRRVGGGTRWSAPRPNPTVAVQNKLGALAFASRNNLPTALKLKAMFS